MCECVHPPLLVEPEDEELKGSATPVIVDGDASIVIGLATATKIGVDFDTDQYKIDNLTGGPVFIDFSFVV